jgi:ketosteroid isomerase-like protein
MHMNILARRQFQCLFYGLGAVLLVGCTPRSFPPDGEASIRDAMQRQQSAWNRGDIPGFMAAYADSACFITAKERTCGKAVVTERYRKHYPDAATMGRLAFGQLEVLGAGPDHAWCTGSWHLYRARDTLAGGFSLFWVRTGGGWKILRDHTY